MGRRAGTPGLPPFLHLLLLLPILVFLLISDSIRSQVPELEAIAAPNKRAGPSSMAIAKYVEEKFAGMLPFAFCKQRAERLIPVSNAVVVFDGTVKELSLRTVSPGRFNRPEFLAPARLRHEIHIRAAAAGEETSVQDQPPLSMFPGGFKLAFILRVGADVLRRGDVAAAVSRNVSTTSMSCDDFLRLEGKLPSHPAVIFSVGPTSPGYFLPSEGLTSNWGLSHVIWVHSTPCFCSLISRLGWFSCMEICNNIRHLSFNFASSMSFLSYAGVDSFFYALMNLLHQRLEGVLLSPVVLPPNLRLSLQPLQLLCLRGLRWSVLPITGAEFIAFLLGHLKDTSPPLDCSTADALFKFPCYVSAPGLDFLEEVSDAAASFDALCILGYSLPKLFMYLHA